MSFEKQDLKAKYLYRKMMSRRLLYTILIVFLPAALCLAQDDATISSRIDAQRISVGDRAKLFIEIQHNKMQSKVQWAVMPDTFNTLEIVEKSKIDTSIQGDVVTYKQKLEITGFDSGSYTIPSFQFSVIPNQGSPRILTTDSFPLLVQTVAVDTTKAYYGIKEIMAVKTTWKDYLLYIAGILVLLAVIVFIVIYFVRNKKAKLPEQPARPNETITQKYQRLLDELENKQLWQGNQVKEYYIELTDLLRNYIEERFNTPAMELTTDELLDKARKHKELSRHVALLDQILRTADLAKFAKAQPLPHEHTASMEATKQFVNTTKPVVKADPTKKQ